MSWVGRIILQLLAQPAYMHSHGRGITEVPAPYSTEQIGLAERLPGIGGEEGEQVELATGQGQLRRATPGNVGRQINGQVTDRQGLVQQSDFR